MGRLIEELDSEDRNLGSGWISGILDVFLAGAGLGAVFVSATQFQKATGVSSFTPSLLRKTTTARQKIV